LGPELTNAGLRAVVLAVLYAVSTSAWALGTPTFDLVGFILLVLGLAFAVFALVGWWIARRNGVLVVLALFVAGIVALVLHAASTLQASRREEAANRMAHRELCYHLATDEAVGLPGVKLIALRIGDARGLPRGYTAPIEALPNVEVVEELPKERKQDTLYVDWRPFRQQVAGSSGGWVAGMQVDFTDVDNRSVGRLVDVDLDRWCLGDEWPRRLARHMERITGARFAVQPVRPFDNVPVLSPRAVMVPPTQGGNRMGPFRLPAGEALDMREASECQPLAGIEAEWKCQAGTPEESAVLSSARPTVWKKDGRWLELVGEDRHGATVRVLERRPTGGVIAIWSVRMPPEAGDAPLAHSLLLDGMRLVITRYREGVTCPTAPNQAWPDPDCYKRRTDFAVDLPPPVGPGASLGNR
jgi:hypothetical protein